MDVGVAGFDWDDGNRLKCQQHEVSLGEIETLFSGRPRMAPDMNHSGGEDRLIAIGRNDAGRPLFVAFTIRVRNGERFIRPITARYMHVREIRRYEAAGP